MATVNPKQAEMMYNRVMNVLTSRETESQLETGDILWADLKWLLNSEHPDLIELALYVLTLMPDSPPHEEIVQTQEAANAFMRFTLAQNEDDSGRSPVPANLLEHPLLKIAHDSLVLDSNESISEPADGHTVVILHGTWAKKQTWWKPGGGFWRYIQSLVGDALYKGSDQSWSGKNSHDARITGAQKFKKWAASKKISSLDVIAHSHGGNVALYAAQAGLKIRNLILLGTPIRLEYLPRLDRIEKIYNVFSTGDMVQQPGAVPNTRGEGRSISDSTVSRNIRVTKSNWKTFDYGHSDLHEEKTWKSTGLYKLLEGTSS